MLNRLTKRGVLVALFAFAGAFATSVANAEVTSVTLLNPHGASQAYGGSDSSHFVTISLAAPAEPGGHAVNLVSSNGDLALTMSTVFVPEGQTAWAFQVALTPTVVASQESATVTATDVDGSTDSNAFSILPMEARFLAGNPGSPLQQGGTYTFSVKLSARVNSTQNVTIGSDNPDVTVENAPVVSGDYIGTFTVNVLPSAVGPVTLTATFNGRSYTVTDNITRAILKSVTAASPTVAPGANSSVTVSFAGVVKGARTINLSYGGPVPSGAPLAVVVPDGASSVTFNVPNNWTRGSKTISVTATYGGVSRFVKISVSP